MTAISVEVDPNSFSDRELLESLKSRLDSSYKSKKSIADLKQQIRDILKIEVEEFNSNPSLLDKMKLDYFLQNIDKITQGQLEKIVEGK